MTRPLPNKLPIDPGTDPATRARASARGHNDGHYSGTRPRGWARANYDVTKNFLVYGSVSTGYKSGGLQDGGRTYGAETLTNYEVGTKNTLVRTAR